MVDLPDVEGHATRAGSATQEISHKAVGVGLADGDAEESGRFAGFIELANGVMALEDLVFRCILEGFKPVDNGGVVVSHTRSVAHGRA